MGQLDGKVAVVTGASRGIGTAIAQRLAANGAAVAVSARTVEAGQSRLEGTITETVGLIEAAGGMAVAIPADLAKPGDREHLIEATEAKLGPVDILVNNAAVTYFEPVEEVSERHYNLMFEVQVKAPFELAQRVLPGMRERQGGWILNISSGAARHPQGPPYRGRGAGTVYGMCKAALERFTTGLAAEVHEAGIAVNVLSPSRLVRTPGTEFHGLYTPEREQFAEPVEVIAEAALALCSGDPATLTGKVTYSQALLEELGREARPLTEVAT